MSASNQFNSLTGGAAMADPAGGLRGLQPPVSESSRAANICLSAHPSACSWMLLLVCAIAHAIHSLAEQRPLYSAARERAWSLPVYCRCFCASWTEKCANMPHLFIASRSHSWRKSNVVAPRGWSFTASIEMLYNGSAVSFQAYGAPFVSKMVKRSFDS